MNVHEVHSLLRRFGGPLPRSDRPERMDLDRASDEELRANLSDLVRINRSLGGLKALTPHLFPRIRRANAERRPGEVLTLLDAGTGAADIPGQVARWAHGLGIPVHLLALDLRASHLRVALKADPMGTDSAIALVQGDALRLPVGEVDFVVCSLTLHHFAPIEAVRLLTELHRAARRSVLVTDLIRSRVTYRATPFVGAWMRWSSMTRHDAHLSILRAYTPAEALALARQAGWSDPRVHWHWPWRFCLLCDK